MLLNTHTLFHLSVLNTNQIGTYQVTFNGRIIKQYHWESLGREKSGISVVDGKCWTIILCLNSRPRILRTSVKLVRSMLLNFFYPLFIYLFIYSTIKKSYFHKSGGVNGHFFDFISNIMEIKIENYLYCRIHTTRFHAGYVASQRKYYFMCISEQFWREWFLG